MIRNKHKVPRGNPTVCEGYGKVNHYPVQNLKDIVPNSNRIIPGHPELLRSTTCNQKGTVMEPNTDINFKAEGALREILFSNEKFEIPETDSKSQCDSGYHNDAYKIVSHGKPMVYTDGKKEREVTTNSEIVNNIINGIEANIADIRAPNAPKSFSRNDFQSKQLAFSAVPFEPWTVEGRDFDPSKPYHPLLLGGLKKEQAGEGRVYKSFNRCARGFGK